MNLLIAAGADVNNGSELPLVSSVKKGTVTCTKTLLKAGADVNCRYKEENTPLMAAVEVSNEVVVDLLLKEGAEINAKNSNEETALYMVVAQGHTESCREPFDNEKIESYNNIVYLLLQAGAQVNESIWDVRTTTSQLNARELLTTNSLCILKLLEAAGADLRNRVVKNNGSLQDLAKNKIREYLIQNHPGKNLYVTIQELPLPSIIHAYLLLYTLQKIDANLNNDEKDLLLKTSDGDFEQVLNLIEDGVDVNVQDENGMTPLMIASQAGNEHLVEELIKAGAGVNIKTYLGDTALIYATENNQIECIRKLLTSEANINVQGDKGNTALIYTVDGLNQDCFQALIERDAIPDIQNDNGDTALQLAILRNSSYCFGKLMKAGANVNLVCNGKKSALRIAIIDEKVNFMTQLIGAGVDVNEVYSDNSTALITAVSLERVECIKTLISAGTDLNMQANYGTTALRFATHKRKFALVTRLLDAGAEIDDTFLADSAREIIPFLAKRGKYCDTTMIQTMIQVWQRKYIHLELKSMAFMSRVRWKHVWLLGRDSKNHFELTVPDLYS